MAEVGQAENHNAVNGENVEITSNWKINNHKSLRDAVTITTQLFPPGNDQIENIVTVDSCVQLAMPPDSADDHSACTITLQCDTASKTGLKQAVVVSEAKKIEVYTDYHEYHTTIVNEFIDRYDDDFIVYKGYITFQKPVLMCTLKFASVDKKSCFWLYGIGVSVAAKPPLASEHGIDMSNICKRLQESDSQLTGRAEKFLHFLHNFKNKDLGNQTVGLLSSLKYIDPKCANELSNTCDGDQTLGTENDERSNTSHSNTQIGCGDCERDRTKQADRCRHCSDDSSTLRNQLRKDFENTLKNETQLLEKRLWEKIDARFQEFEERQNRQIVLLSQLIETLKYNDSRTESIESNNNNKS